MSEHGQREPEAGARAALEREHRVRAVPGEPGACPLGLEQRLGHRARVAERGASARGERADAGGPNRAQRSPRRRRDPAEQRRRELVPLLDERLDQPPVGGAVAAELLDRLVERALEHDRRPVVERMRGRRAGMYPLDRQVERAEERRADRQRQHTRADVVQEPGQRQLLGVQAAAEVIGGLAHLDLHALLSQDDRRREPVRPRADDEGAAHARRDRSAGPSACPPCRTGSNRSPCFSTRSSASRMPKSRGRTFGPSSSQRSGVETGAPGFGRTE